MRPQREWTLTKVQLSQLDEIVVEYCKQERLCEETSDSAGDVGPSVREQCAAAQAAVLRGDVLEGVKMASQIDARALQENSKLKFRLELQYFVELLRRGAHSEALDWSRKVLATHALDAYPEAFIEFKQVMLLMMNVDGMGVAVRSELAGVLGSTLRVLTDSHDSRLSLLLRYLVLTHDQYVDATKGPDSPVADMCRSLVGPDRRAAPYQKELIPSVELLEHDVQALCQATGISRQSAVESLQHTNGELSKAVKNELSRVELDDALVDSLVREYAFARELVVPSGQAESGGDAEAGTSAGDTAHAPVWRGRPNAVPIHSGAVTDDVERGHRNQTLQIRELVLQGKMEEVVARVSALKPDFFEAHPKLLFELKRCELQRLCETGSMDEALALARTHLAPLTVASPDLLPTFQQAMMHLTCPGVAAPAPIEDYALASTLQTALSNALGLGTPRLIHLLQVLLHAHQQWMRLLKVSDRFSSLFGIDALRASSAGSSAQPGQDSEDNLAEGVDMDYEEDAADENDDISDSAILTIQEFLALSRLEARELLVQYGGSLESVMAHVLT
mmetsp:Transcript_28387/g.92705  ORF Transcript_28387/g.92705 Transcript_28387/m.92705 type:complete len:562 (+) Transcript_28387:361-2046(+)